MALWYPQCRATLSVVFDGFGGGLGPEYFGPGDDTVPQIIQTQPITATCRLNGYKEADTWELEFDAKLLPVKPDLMRAIAVEIYMFETNGLRDNPENYATDENRVIAGLADNASLHYGSDGHTVRMDGRDYTALFLDKPWPPDKKVPVGLPLDQVVQLLAQDAQNRVIVDPRTGKRSTIKVKPLIVVFVGANEAPVVGAQGKALTLKKVKAPPVVGAGHSRAVSRGIPFKSGQNYWDVIYKLCLRHGHVCFVQGDKIVISDPKTLAENSIDSIANVAFGRNLMDLSFERHLGKESVPQVVVTGRDIVSGQTLEAKFPENPPPKQTGIGTAKEEQRRYVMGGVNDVAVLKKYAQLLYHNLARVEGKVRFSTMDLRDLPRNQGERGPFNLLQLRPGNAVAVGFDAFNAEQLQALKTTQARYDRMIQLGYDKNIASLVAREYQKLAEARQAYYVKSVSFDWDVNKGIQTDVEAANFVAAGRDAA
jgi:hypothetical protein